MEPSPIDPGSELRVRPVGVGTGGGGHHGDV